MQLVDKGLPYNIPKVAIQVFENGLVDSYSISQLGKDGQKLTVSFRYSYEHESKVNTEVLSEELLDENFTFRLLTDSEDDIIEAIKCLYSAYEYNYLATELYYHDAFKRKINSGNYHAIICENEHHQSIGYCALNCSPFLPNLPEFCSLVTKPIARGKGIATKLLEFAEKVAIQNNYNGIEICPAAFHPFTQKITNASGYTPCGLNVAIAPPEARGAFIDGDIRGSETIAVKLINDNKVHKVFVPEVYRPFVASIFDSIGSKYEYIDEYSTSPETFTEYEAITQKLNDVTYIYINKAGDDLEEKIKSITGEIDKPLFESTTLFFNVSTPSQKSAYDCLAKYGFKLGGFIPGASNGDFLFFQRLKNPYPYDSLVLEDNFSAMCNEIYDLWDK